MARLEFAGARYVRNYHLAVPHHELEIDKKKSFQNPRLSKAGAGSIAHDAGGFPSLEDNLIIHGDNLKALKSLLPHFAGRVKCIYIDPPYNTGNENWVYNDNVNSPRHKEWLNKVVDKDCQDRHDRWLSMMMPRLKLLRELLRDDGVIFISIDDNEVDRLRLLLDEIFGEQHYVTTFVWKRRTSSALAERRVSTDHEYVLAYQKGDFDAFSGVPKDYQNYNNPDNDPNGPWMIDNPTVGMTKDQRPNQFYDLVDPRTGWKFPANPNRVWAWIPETMQKLIDSGRIIFPKDKNGKPQFKKYQKDLKTDVNPISSFIFTNGNDEEDRVTLTSGLNSEATRELQNIFGNKQFDYAKPVSLISSLIRQVAFENDLILDSFAGSGTTAHAVLALNKEDGGRRKFILVEQEDYADTITAERVRRVIKGVKTAKDENLKNGLGGSFTYVTLGQEISENGMLSGKALPSYETLAEYCFFTATGPGSDTPTEYRFDAKKMDRKSNYIGTSKDFDVYLFYEPDVAKLKSNDTALTFNWVELQPKRDTIKGQKTKLVFAPVRYVGQETLTEYDIEFCQLPWEIYRKLETA